MGPHESFMLSLAKFLSSAKAVDGPRLRGSDHGL